MAVHQLKAIQQVPGSIEMIWDYFSRPGNLAKITPVEMDFRVISESPDTGIYPGQIIEYTVRPLLGIPFYWMTEITQVEHGKYFIDEQRKGPYSMWHHQHHFKVIDGGVEMTDLVHYQNPLGFLGEIANGMIVRKKLKALFDHRSEKISSQFGGDSGATINIR